jgi:glyoxylase-like metal-dependent hydrolase (beta-lactamase superfamily II)
MPLIGDVEVTRIEEAILREPTTLFSEWRDEILDEHRWMVPNCFEVAAGTFLASIHSWLVRTKRHTILIDSCAGNHKERPLSPRFHQLNTPFLDRLQAAGVRPEGIDYVLCTHLHVDHVGWNTQLRDGRWVPTFPNAKYVFSRAERDRWDPKHGAATKPIATHAVFLDSVLPVIEAGQDFMVEGEDEIGDGLHIMPTPGHTPGHVSIRLLSGRHEGIFTGVMHQPIQVYYPQWNGELRRAEAARCAAAAARTLAEYGSLLLPPISCAARRARPSQETASPSHSSNALQAAAISE